MPSPSPVRQGRGGRGEEGEDPAETQAGPEEAEISGDTLLAQLPHQLVHRRAQLVGLVLERDVELRAKEHLVAAEVKILFDYLGNSQFPDGLLGRLHRGDRGILPRRGARPDELNDLVHAHGASLLMPGLMPVPDPCTTESADHRASPSSFLGGRHSGVGGWRCCGMSVRSARTSDSRYRCSSPTTRTHLMTPTFAH